MSPLIQLILVSLLSCIIADEINFMNSRHLLQQIPVQAPSQQPNPIDIKREEDQNTISLKLNKSKEVTNKINTPVKTIKNGTRIEDHKNETKVEEPKIIKSTEMESGALLRGVTVVIVLTMLVLIYMAVRTYCGKKVKQPMVSKYGVRTRRSDIEMAPLQLDDDDDETLFEVNSPSK